jgi:alpha-tubulin suppressor-like RCC1 family protein
VPVRVRVPAGTTITSVRSGCGFSLAVTAAGQALAWGIDNLGQLGNGTENSLISTPKPVKLPAGTKVKAVRAGCDFGLALTTTGRVLAWGDNGVGELGNLHLGGSADTPAPVVTSAGDPVTAIAAGTGHALQHGSDGRREGAGLGR